MPRTLPVPKTYKLFVGGGFPRSESGRTLAVHDGRGRVAAHVCRASRKDLRDAVEAASAALPRWSGLTAYHRGQILYRIAEMLEGRATEMAEALAQKLETAAPPEAAAAERVNGRRSAVRRRAGGDGAGRAIAPRAEVAAAVDRLISFAGWTDKHAEILGRRAAVAGPYHVFSLPTPVGVVAVVAPDSPPLLGLVALVAAAICTGNTVVCLASERHPIPAALYGEVLATSDVPPGAVNFLTGLRAELLPHIAGHREIRAASAADLPEDQAALLHAGAAENLKRVHVAPRGAPAIWLDDDAETSPERLAPFVDIKTIWHPSGC